jgi:hypothetical protein
MSKFRIFLVSVFILFVATMNMRQADAQGGTNPVPTVPTIPPTLFEVFLSYIEQAHVRLTAVELALTQEEIGPAFIKTGGSTGRSDYYDYAYVVIENGPINITEDVYVMDELAQAQLDYADTTQFYRDDPLLTELAAATIGDESAFFKGQGLQYLLIIRRANVVFILGTTNYSPTLTLELGQKATGKL